VCKIRGRGHKMSLAKPQTLMCNTEVDDWISPHLEHDRAIIFILNEKDNSNYSLFAIVHVVQLGLILSFQLYSILMTSDLPAISLNQGVHFSQ